MGAKPTGLAGVQCSEGNHPVAERMPFKRDDHTHIATEIRNAQQPKYAPAARGSRIDDLVICSRTSPADQGLDYEFLGNGSIGVLGHADVTGSLHSLGNITEGQARRLIVLSTPKGSLTLHLTGPEQKGFAKLPDRFTFKITNSSDKYLGDAGTGTVVFVRDPAGTNASQEHGTFTMVFASQ
jgi:hypothetical protein